MDNPKRKYNKHKEGYKVSVKYFLRKDKALVHKEKAKNAELPKFLAHVLLNATPNTVTTNRTSEVVEEPTYPLYISISFLKQTVNIRSRLTVHLKESELDSYLNGDTTSTFIQNEELAIRFSIQEFKPEEKLNFKIRDWTEYYNQYNIELINSVESNLRCLFIQDLLDRYAIKKNRENWQELLFFASRLKSFEFLAKLGIELAQDYYDTYRPVIDLLSATEVQALRPKPTLWDLKTGYFQHLLLGLYGATVLGRYEPVAHLANQVVKDPLTEKDWQAGV